MSNQEAFENWYRPYKAHYGLDDSHNSTAKDAYDWAIKQQAAELEAEIKWRDEMIEALEEKIRSLAPHNTCACSYDKPGDVCLHHSPQLAKQAAELDALRGFADAIGVGRPFYKGTFIEEWAKKFDLIDEFGSPTLLLTGKDGSVSA